MKEILNNWKLWFAASLTLGMAPFLPEPHLLGKIRWVMGGANGMQTLDWFDLVLHGFPVVLLLRAIFIKFGKK